MGGVSFAGDYAVMKKISGEKEIIRKSGFVLPDGTVTGKQGAAGKKSGIFQITLVPFNLRSKF